MFPFLMFFLPFFSLIPPYFLRFSFWSADDLNANDILTQIPSRYIQKHDVLKGGTLSMNIS